MLLVDLFEVKARDISLLTNEELTELVVTTCNDIDWYYDIDPLNEPVFEAGVSMHRRAEKYLAELFSRNKTAAMNLWESQCPFAIPGMIPSFLGMKK